MQNLVKSFVERAGKVVSLIGLLLAPLLYLLLKKKSAEVADLKSKARVSDAENEVEKAKEATDVSAADYAAKRAEYDKLRK